MPASESQSPAESGFNGNFATLNSYFRRDSALSGRSGKSKANAPFYAPLLGLFGQGADYLQFIQLGSDRTSFEEDTDPATRDRRSYVFSSCKFSDESHVVIGSVKAETSINQQTPSNYKYRFDEAEFKGRSKVVSGDMDGETYQKCVNIRSAT
jgi:hypothetical protein